MTQVIDVRSSGGEYVILGGGLVLPMSINPDITPSTGAIRFNASTHAVEYYNGTSWVALIATISYANLPTEIQYSLAQVSLPGSLQANQNCMTIPIVMNMQLPANFSGSAGYSGINAAASAAFTVAYIHSGSPISIGTITFSSSGATPTLSTQAAVNLVPGDVLLMTTPSVADASLANVGITLKLVKQ